jgi:hypothetical protein
MTQDYNQAYSFIAAFAGDPAAVDIDFRAIHDVRKDIPAIPFRGKLPDCWPSICHYNEQGYGIFVTIAAMDGHGRELSNVAYLRAHYIDLDNLSAQQNYDRATQAYPPPSFAVNTSPGKYHVYWTVAPYIGNDRFQIVQRKLRQVFDGDKRVIDAARVMRLAGTLHLKNPLAPHNVTCWSLGGYTTGTTVDALEQALAAVNIIDGGSGGRHELGDPGLAAPSFEWCKRALELVDPNQLDRGQWVSMLAAYKQAAWSFADEATIRAVFDEWCARYEKNDIGENEKQWNSIRNTELGWGSLLARIPSLKAAFSFDKVTLATPPTAAPDAAPGLPAASLPPVNTPPPLDCSGAILTDYEQREWFKGCLYVVVLKSMFTPSGRFMDAGQFNVFYGGKRFIIDSEGKTTDEAWKAATRSTLWQVPKVDHTRFLPHRPYGEVVEDDLGNKGVNVYRPVNVRRVQGDVSPFLWHVAALLPDPRDQAILLSYLAHNVKFPGYKIPWAPLIQSAEGAGKGVLKLVMKHCMGRSYTYFPKASDLAESGAKFNAWLRNKLFILVDEIKVDERRELIEVLKPLISEEETEIQSKGVDQGLEDNFSNWCFFSNWRDAIPVNKNARRFAIFYSPLQTAQDLIARGMNEEYFNRLYEWLRGDGAAVVADYLMNYPVEYRGVPMRAPETSSTVNAVSLSRGPVERVIDEAIEDGLQGFRNGWISATAVAKRVKASGAVRTAPTFNTISTILEAMGYVASGRAPKGYMQEDPDNLSRPHVFHRGGVGNVAEYGRSQGYE